MLRKTFWTRALLLVAALAARVCAAWAHERGVGEVYGDPSRVDDALVDRDDELTLREGNRRPLVQRYEQLRPGPTRR